METIRHSQWLDAAALEARGRFKDLRFDSSSDRITLDDMLLVEDDAPAIGRPEGAEERSWFEHLHRGVVVRKDLVLDDARARAAFLLFNGREEEQNDHPLHLRVNGEDIVRPPTKEAHPAARQYYTSDWGGSHFDNWFAIEIPVQFLRCGRNEIWLWAESEQTSWEVMVAADAEYLRGSETRVAHPDRSAKSVDQGATWDFAHLGWKGEVDGEYCIRLSLDRYRRAGEYISPVIDVAANESLVRELLSVRRCRLAWELETPEGSRAEIKVRWSESPLQTADWSPFDPVRGCTAIWERPPGRYVQFAVAMATDNPLATPVLKGLAIEADLAPGESGMRCAYRVLDSRNGQVLRSSLDFVHEDFYALRELREDFELDQVVAGAGGEFAAQLRLMRWAYEIPLGRLNPYAWDYRDLPQLAREAGGEIKLEPPTNRRRRDGHCLYCNLTLVAACLALGYPARWVNISTVHTYGHEVAEVWSNEFDKWIFLDATRDYYIYDPESGIPLNLVEISSRLAEVMPAPATWEYPVQWQIPDLTVLKKVRIAYREGDHQYPVNVPKEGEAPEFLTYKGHLQMPLRNDFASRPHPVPWRVSSNWGGDQFYCYYGEMFPRKREYQHQTNRWQDFSPRLNQTEFYLSETGNPEVLEVALDTETPGFETWLVAVDGEPWRVEKRDVWEWNLHEGWNGLRAKVRNSMGICGPESWVSIVVNL